MPPLDELEPPMSSDLNQSDSYNQHNSLQHLQDLDPEHGNIKCVRWNPAEESHKMLTGKPVFYMLLGENSLEFVVAHPMTLAFYLKVLIAPILTLVQCS